MSEMYFSARTKGFYAGDMKDAYVAAGSWPDDGVRLSKEDYEAFRSPPPGHSLGADADGRPTWIANPFDAAKARANQRARLAAACTEHVTTDFTSAALGAVHSYPHTPTDQMNLLAAATLATAPKLPASWSTPLWCADAAGAWALRAHSAAQVQQVAKDARAVVTAAQARHAALAAEIAAAETHAAIHAVVWSADAADGAPAGG